MRLSITIPIRTPHSQPDPRTGMPAGLQVLGDRRCPGLPPGFIIEGHSTAKERTMNGRMFSGYADDDAAAARRVWPAAGFRDPAGTTAPAPEQD